VADYDLVIVGAGSGNMLANEELAGLSIAVVESDRFGGTCLNRGCLPSKMLVYAADIARTTRDAERFGIQATFVGADWPAIRDRIFGRIDPMHDRAVAHRRRLGAHVYLAAARFTAPKVLDVGGEVVRGEQIVVAVGSRPRVPEIPGLDSVAFHTSDTIMRIEQLPVSLVVLGGGPLAAEMSYIFGALGTHVTIVHRGEVLLADHDEDVRRRFTEECERRYDVRLGTRVDQVASSSVGVALDVSVGAKRERIEAEMLLVAVGRIPNSDHLDVVAGGLDVDEHGHVITDATGATNVPGVWAIGDLANHYQVKNVANAEARAVRHNVLHPTAPIPMDPRFVPSAVFADPQVASVGETEQQLRARGAAYLVGRRDFSDTGYGWAMEDTTSFAKLLADPQDRRLLGAHIVGPQASILVQSLVQAMCLGNTVDQLVHDVMYAHPALVEVVEQALLAIDEPQGT
jgi:mycothione reductase